MNYYIIFVNYYFIFGKLINVFVSLIFIIDLYEYKQKNVNNF